MYTDHRLRPIWVLIVFVLLIGMNCSLLSGGAGNSQVEDEATPPPMPTAEGVIQDDLPIPLPPDAANFSSSQASFSYSTQLSVEEVARFYREVLPPQGWTITERGDAEGTLMWEVSRQNTKYMLSIMPSNGMTIVNAAQIQ